MKQQSFNEMRCSLARTLEVVGTWWSLLIIRDSLQGIRRFGDFHQSLGIPKNTLSSRLSDLVEHGVLRKVSAEDGSKYDEYELTAKGRDLSPILISMAQWGDKWEEHKEGRTYLFIDEETGEEIDRVWPRRANGEKIPLNAIKSEDPQDYREKLLQN